jgi:hypothetical protein
VFIQKCNHDPCQCQVSHGTRIDWSGRHFCSHYCATSPPGQKAGSDVRCHCGHKECEPKKEAKA